MAWSGGQIKSNKEVALSRFLSRSTEGTKEEGEKTRREIEPAVLDAALRSAGGPSKAKANCQLPVASIASS